ncbi:glycoside hydrolase [Fusarium albosuccineum]|uniref:Glycoside hydrolase n=1 Tax=Fusarium albosuccineum TaxID=1237068 RepID=A0A8H4L7L4_9HYPO|nr:glycoside hydrolase [Fusarium albosuccineum]
MRFNQFVAWASLTGSLSVSTAELVSILKRDAAGTATVYLNEPSGKPQNLASGFIYGLPDDPDGSANSEIPESYIKGIGFNYCRAGGAQLKDSLGWVANQYEGRWNSTLSNYRTTRRYGGRFTLLMHDLWGADSLQAADFQYPGDNGDWKSYDEFLDQVFSDIKKHHMYPGLDIDIWNEPDLSGFWDTTQEQYLAMWERTHTRIRNELPGVPITGPSTSTPATANNQWWEAYMKHISKTATVPDIYSWHLLSPNRNLRESKQQFEVLRKDNKLPNRPLTINEYAWTGNDEQSPAGAVFYISQLERHNAHGLRANWGSGPQLHDLMANLLVKQDGNYSPTGEWHVYNYYHKEMKGFRVTTSPSDDEFFEVYATHAGSPSSVKVLASVRPIAGTKTYGLSISGLSAVGISGQSVDVRTRRFDGPDRQTTIQGPVDLGVERYDIKNDEITLSVSPDQVTNAFAFELEV